MKICRTCNKPVYYIRADFLENEVWKKIRQALEKRENALAGVNEQIEAEKQKLTPGTTFDSEIKKSKQTDCEI
jgi:hypothetical protein